MFDRMKLILLQEVTLGAFEEMVSRLLSKTPVVYVTTDFQVIDKHWADDRFTYMIRGPHGFIDFAKGDRGVTFSFEGREDTSHLDVGTCLEVDLSIDLASLASTVEHGGGWSVLTMGDHLRQHVEYDQVLCEELYTLGDMYLAGLWLPRAFPEAAVVRGLYDHLLLSDALRVFTAIATQFRNTPGNLPELLYADELYTAWKRQQGVPNTPPGPRDITRLEPHSSFMRDVPREIHRVLKDPTATLKFLPKELPSG